jgi:pyruvate-formate lyase
MMMAEADGLIIRDWRVFWMGHKGDIEARYTTNKGKLSDDLVEKMREAFAKASDKYLVTSTKRDTAIDAVKAQFNRQFLLIAGFSEQEADALGDLSQLTPADISKLVQDKQKKALGLNGNTQKVVPILEVKQYIMQGWEYVALLQDEAIIRLPAV